MNTSSGNIPDCLYPYRIFCRGAVFKVLTTHTDVDALWDEILRLEEGEKRLICWTPPKDGRVASLRIRPSLIIAIDDVLGTEPVQLNREERRREDLDRRTTAKYRGPVSVGQVAKRG